LVGRAAVGHGKKTGLAPKREDGQAKGLRAALIGAGNQDAGLGRSGRARFSGPRQAAQQTAGGHEEKA
jgi:hypothetical protein